MHVYHRNKLFNDLVLEVEAIVGPRQGGRCLLQIFNQRSGNLLIIRKETQPPSLQRLHLSCLLLQTVTVSRKRFQIAFATFDFFIDDDFVKPLRTFKKLVSQIKKDLARDTESKEVLLHPTFGLFNSLGNLHLLLPC